MTQGTTASQPSLLDSKFSCHWADKGGINGGSVKALLPARDDLFSPARVGSWLFAYAFLALANSSKNQPVDQTQAAGLRTTDLPQISAGGSDHGRQR
jgi:hypothetical protein